MFKLHPQLAHDCFSIGHFALSQLLLMNDAQYPWFILVPQRENVSEIYHMEAQDQRQLLWESSYLSQQLASHFKADKMNVAALGNVVPQLHVHHIVRYRSDPAWPTPVWGKLPAIPYSDEAVTNVLEQLANVIRENFIFETSHI